MEFYVRVKKGTCKMNIINKLERKFGKYAIPNLMYYVAILYAIGLLVSQLAPQVYLEYLMLDASKILRGQIWRVITFMMWPVSGGMFINILIIYCYYNLGRALEYVWGTFRFNLFFLMGIVGHVLAAIVIYLAFGVVYPLTAEYLNFSLFFAYALTFPNNHFFLFMIVPNRYNPKEIRRRQQFKTQMNETVREAKKVGRHRCAVCGITDIDNPEMTFRYCSKCEGDFEYCQDHLYTHQHVHRGGMDPRQAESSLASQSQEQ